MISYFPKSQVASDISIHHHWGDCCLTKAFPLFWSSDVCADVWYDIMTEYRAASSWIPLNMVKLS